MFISCEQQLFTDSTDKSKIASWVYPGNVLDLATAIKESQPCLCLSYAEFVYEPRKVFDHPVYGGDSTYCLLSLRQGSRSVAEFSVKLQTVATDSGWNNHALQGMLLRMN